MAQDEMFGAQCDHFQVFGAFVICLLLSLLVFAIEVWYAMEYDIENRIARSRVIIVMVS